MAAPPRFGLCGLQGADEVLSGPLGLARPFLPERRERAEAGGAHPLDVGVGVLDDETRDLGRRAREQAKAYRAAAVVHVEHVALKTDRFDQPRHVIGQVLEGVANTPGSGASDAPKPM